MKTVFDDDAAEQMAERYVAHFGTYHPDREMGYIDGFEAATAIIKRNATRDRLRVLFDSLFGADDDGTNATAADAVLELISRA